MATRGPIEIEETPGIVAWCACGRTRYAPYCDGSHGDSGIGPVIVEIERAGRMRWCGCGRSSRAPYCDDRACADSG